MNFGNEQNDVTYWADIDPPPEYIPKSHPHDVDVWWINVRNGKVYFWWFADPDYGDGYSEQRGWKRSVFVDKLYTTRIAQVRSIMGYL